MKKLLLILFVLLVAVVVGASLVADAMLGVAAFTYGYLVFCLVAALVLGAGWLACFRKHALLVGLGVFSLLAINLFLPPSSERLLRSAMLKLPPGTDADAIESIVMQEYKGSAFGLPRITKERVNVSMQPDEPARELEQIHFSLSSQQPGNATSISFLIENGVVVKSYFAPD